LISGNLCKRFCRCYSDGDIVGIKRLGQRIDGLILEVREREGCRDADFRLGIKEYPHQSRECPRVS
jgi:hypothetical protein